MSEERFEVRDRRNGSWFWCQNLMLKAKIPHTVKLAYFALCSFANKNTESCYPSIAKVAEIAGISRNSVIRAMKVLEKAKAIKIKKEKGWVNQYLLLKLTSSTMGLVSQEYQNQSQKRHKTSPPRDTLTNERNKRKNNRGMSSLRNTMSELGLVKTL